MSEFKTSSEELAALMMAVLPGIDKPFGMAWSDNKMEYYLTERGYRFLDRVSDCGETYKVVVKQGVIFDAIPEESNVYQMFISEIQDNILEILLKK